MSFQPASGVSPFLPSTVYLPEDDEQRIITNNLILNQIVKAVNLREISTYELFELVTGQSWFSATVNVKRAVYRTVYEVGAIAAAGTLNIAHGITNLVQFTRIYGTVITAAPDFRPLPRVSATLVTDQISLDVGAVNITIVNGATAPNITSGIVVLEYLKN